jgi:hypothetical protein
VTWTKLGDELVSESHRLSDAALRLHVEALIYSNSKLLDLLVPDAALRKIHDGRTDLLAVVAELEALAWWERRGPDWFIGLRWPEWQRSRAQVERDRKAGSERAERSRRHRTGDHSICLPASCSAAPTSGNAVTTAVTNTARLGELRDGSGRVGKERYKGKELSNTETRNETATTPNADPFEIVRCLLCGWPADSAEHYAACADSAVGA